MWFEYIYLYFFYTLQNMVLVFQEESWRIVCCVSTLNPLDIFTCIICQSHFICCVFNYSFETLCPFLRKNETIANAISSLKHFKMPLIHDAIHLSKLHIQTNIRTLITTTTLKGDFIMKSSKQTAKLKNTIKKYSFCAAYEWVEFNAF